VRANTIAIISTGLAHESQPDSARVAVATSIATRLISFLGRDQEWWTTSERRGLLHG
jgi:hypothetical protein